MRGITILPSIVNIVVIVGELVFGGNGHISDWLIYASLIDIARVAGFDTTIEFTIF